MGTTANYSFPYPAAGDSPAGMTQIQALASAVDTELASQVATLTADIGAITAPQFVCRTSEASFSAGTTFQNDPVLVLSLDDSAAIYQIHGFVKYDSDATGLFKHKFAVPVGSNMRYVTGHSNVSDTWFQYPASGADIIESYANGPGATYAITFDGTIFMNGTTGNVQFQFANYSSATHGPTIYDGSYMEITKMSG